jgi:hypothetical protein
MIPINQIVLDQIKSSSKAAQDVFKSLKIRGWPKVVTTEPGKHFLDKSKQTAN